tara:strand:+ start:1659 stop:1991 length:333 start_codon:yes stop_codon:yes gene_type:complete
MSKDLSSAAMLVAAGLVTSIFFSFLFTASLAETVKDSDWLSATFGIQVDLNDGKISREEFMPAIRIMITLWLFFALMRIVHHNVDMVAAIILATLPKDVSSVFRMGGYKD